MNERIKKTEEKLASLMIKQQSIIEKQDTELKKIAALEDLTRKQKNTIDELSKEKETDNALGNKLSSLEKQVQSAKKTIM